MAHIDLITVQILNTCSIVKYEKQLRATYIRATAAIIQLSYVEI